jgi:hypothetical protein
LNKNLCAKGDEKALKEVQTLAGESFIDFRINNDGFDGDCYAFLKCLKSIDMGPFRKSSYVVAVLDSYDNPTFLTDSEVTDFTDVEDDEEKIFTQYGDMVEVTGNGYFSGLHGVVVEGGCENSLVIFRFHTVTKKERISNDDLIVFQNAFKKLKIPVKNIKLKKGRDGKYPIIYEEG